MQTPVIKLALADDHTLFRESLKNYLTQQKNFNVILQAADAHELLNKLKKTQVDILLTDVFMPLVSIHDSLKVIRAEYPEMKIIVLSISTDLQLINDLMDIGIQGYISKSDNLEELIQAIIAVSEDRIYRNKLFTEALYLNKQNTLKANRKKNDILFSERERKIMQLLWEEKSNKEIADELFLSIRSIEKIRQDMKEKLEVKSTIGLLKYALHNKIITGYPEGITKLS